MPSPVPEPDVTLSHVVVVVAVQLQFVEMVKLPEAPLVSTIALAGLNEKLQVAPAWVTVNVCPATFSVPVRACTDVFATTVYPTLPSPVPGDPNDTVIHGALLVAVRAQLLALAAIVTSPFPPAAAKLAVFGVSENEHCAASGDAASNALNARMARRREADRFNIDLSIISKIRRRVRNNPTPPFFVARSTILIVEETADDILWQLLP